MWTSLEASSHTFPDLIATQDVVEPGCERLGSCAGQNRATIEGPEFLWSLLLIAEAEALWQNTASSGSSSQATLSVPKKQPTRQRSFA